MVARVTVARFGPGWNYTRMAESAPLGVLRHTVFHEELLSLLSLDILGALDLTAIGTALPTIVNA